MTETILSSFCGLSHSSLTTPLWIRDDDDDDCLFIDEKMKHREVNLPQFTQELNDRSKISSPAILLQSPLGTDGSVCFVRALEGRGFQWRGSSVAWEGKGRREEAERANVDRYCKEGRGTHRSWKGTQEWQKPFCVSNERVFERVDSLTVCLHHTPELLKEKWGGWMRRHAGYFQLWFYYSTTSKFFLSGARWNISLDNISWKNDLTYF